MGIKYRTTKKKFRDNGDNGVIKEKYFAKIVSNGEVSLKEVAELVAESSTLASYEVEMVIKALACQMKTLLVKGNTVDLGELGRFKVGFKSKACETPEDISCKSVTKMYINYKSHKDLLQAVRNASLEQDRRCDENGNYVKYSHSKKTE